MPTRNPIDDTGEGRTRRHATGLPLALVALSPAAYVIRGEIEHHFAFNDPNRFPNLYRPSDRFDRDHLTEEASLRFNRLLAERFVEIAGARAR